jgi:hypothetical protein
VFVVLVAIMSAVHFDWLSNWSASQGETIAQGPAFEVVDLHGKGKGVVALRDIKVSRYSSTRCAVLTDFSI